MAQNAQSIRMGACHVVWGGVDLGMTQGGVSVTVKSDTKRLFIDQFSGVQVDDVIMGRTIDVQFALAETDIASAGLWMPKIGGSSQTASSVTIGSGSGVNLKDIALPLSLQPIINDGSLTQQTLTVLLAAPNENITFAYKHDQVRVFTVNFVGYPDTSGKLLTFDETEATSTSTTNTTTDRSGDVIVARSNTDYIAVR